MREHASQDGEPEPLGAADAAHVAHVELNATGVAPSTQTLIGFDPRSSPRQQGRRAVDADQARGPTLEQHAEQAPGTTTEVDRGAALPASPLAIEGEVLADLVVLEVVDLGQRRVIDGLAGQDVAQPDVPR
jgi:hypothetical protein